MTDEGIFQIRFHYRLVLRKADKLKDIRIFQNILRFLYFMSFFCKPPDFFLVLFPAREKQTFV